MHLTYKQARWIVLGFGAALIGGVTLSTFARGADPVEVLAVLLFLPVLVALAFGRARWGAVAGVVVSIAYVVIRSVTLPEGLPMGEFVGTAIVRTLLYIGLGLFGGYANEMLEHALHKLELYDEIDDDTGVGNARSLLSMSDREAARARRYGSVFSLSVLTLERGMFDEVQQKDGLKALRQLCQTVEASVRTTDLVARVPHEAREDVVVVLPETGRAGAEIFLERLIPGARDMLNGQGMHANGTVGGQVLTIPGDEEAFEQYQREVAVVVQAQTLEDDDTETPG